MVLLLWFLCLPWVLSAVKRCEFNPNPLYGAVSPELKSLQCYNDFKSHFHCTWKEEPKHPPDRRLQLYLHKKQLRRIDEGPCNDFPSAVNGTRQCRFETKVFSYGSTYTAFFRDPLRPCSSIKPPRQVQPLLLRARTPEHLNTSSAEDGGSLITWSSPYPQSSALKDDITYEVSYRPHGQHDWTTEELPETQKRLGKEKLIPGHGYEARVRARVGLGHWSHWSPIVSWHTRLDPEWAPRVDCVLWGEREANCSWEQGTELGRLISYQLVCRPDHAATPRECCEKPVVNPGHGEDTVEISCLVPLTDSSSTLMVELVPTRSAKTLHSWKLIRPYPPTQVTVTEKGPNWVVEWTRDRMQDNGIEDFKLSHQVQYNSEQSQEDVLTMNISSTHSSANILGSSLHPSHKYWVKVRSLVEHPHYEGVPSDWSPPVEWTPGAASLLVRQTMDDTVLTSWIYALVAVVLSAVFITVFLIPACRRRIVLWAESLPSPDKSKAILDIKVVKYLGITVNEEINRSKVMAMDSESTCSTIVSLGPKKELDVQTEEAEDVSVSLDKSSMNFSGPYIFFPSVESKPVDEDISAQTEETCPDVGHVVLGSPGPCSYCDEGYVRLPSSTVSTSTQDLSSRSLSSTDDQINTTGEEEEHCLSNDDVSETFWPQGGTTQSSGYCQLPTDFTQAQP